MESTPCFPNPTSLLLSTPSMDLKTPTFAQKHYRLELRLRKIEENQLQRKNLIKICLYRALELLLDGDTQTRPNSKGTTNNNQNNQNYQNKQNNQNNTKTSYPNKSWTSESQEKTLKKLHDYERRVFVLKLEISTKEQAHEAKLDQLNTLIDKLQARIDQFESTSSSLVKNILNRPHTSPLLMASRPTTVMSTSAAKRVPVINQSPFSGDLSRTSFLSGSDFAKIASKATLKLSRDVESRPNAILFSPNTSSTESTPKRDNESTHKRDTEPKSDINKQDLNLSSSSLISSESEETFQTANGTFGEGAEKKKKRRIRLLSSQASKVSLSETTPGTDDVNSLDYYLDANFEDEVSPLPTAKRALEDNPEPPAKKRHVFKIQ